MSQRNERHAAKLAGRARNLQIMPREENRRKSNKVWPDMP